MNSRTPLSQYRPLMWIRALALTSAALMIACSVSDQPLDVMTSITPAPTPSHHAMTIPSAAEDIPADRRHHDAPVGYDFRRLDDRAHAFNASQGLAATVDAEAALRISTARPTTPAQAWDVSLRWEGVGRSGAISPVPEPTAGPSIVKGAVRFERTEQFEEWFANGPLGMEQGFYLIAPPSLPESAQTPGLPESPLVLELQVSGSVHAVTTPRAGTLSLQDEAGRTILSYSGLVAWDANGQQVPCWLDAQGTTIQIVVDDRGASYPLTIDPILWVIDQKILQDGAGTNNDQLGYSVAISGDTAVVGAFGNDEKGVDAGAAYVFTREGSTWVQQQKLLASDGMAGDFFGASVAIDGDTIVVGAYGNDEAGAEAGAAYVFLRSANQWTEHKKILPTSLESLDYFGISVAIQGDTMIVGANGDDDKGSMAGAAYIFRQNAGGTNAWGQQAKLTADAGAEQDQFGIAVAVDGSSVLIGASGDSEKGSLAGAAYVFARTGSNWSQQSKLMASDAAALDKFGSALSISGDTIAVGASLANTPSADAGAAYVFVRNGTDWTQQQKIIALDSDVQDYFGAAIAVHGDRMVVGAWGDKEAAANAGAAYVFQRSGTNWTQQAKVLSTGIVANDWFGIAVALDGTRAIVGATGEDDTGSNCGAAFIFEQDSADPSSWPQQDKLLATDGLAAENLGYAVAVDGSLAVVGAYGARDRGIATGAAYVFSREAAGWKQLARLTPSDGAATDRFGFAVDISGETVVVGAYQHDGVGSDEGAAYIFVRSGSTWSQQAKLVAGDAAASDYFGVAVAVDGDTAVIGSYADDDKGSNSGSVYVFERSGTAWNQAQKLVASDGAANDNFGRAVALQGNTIVVGSPNDDDGASNSGSAYVFEKTGTSWSAAAKLNAADPNANAYFGFSVAVDADTVIAGAYRDNSTAANMGAAYVFVRDSGTFSQQAKLVGSESAAEDRFAQSVAIFGDVVMVSAHLADPKGSNSGAAYVFGRQGATWTERQILIADDAAANDNFGIAVAVYEDLALVGSNGDDDKGSSSGAVYAYILRKTLGEACAEAGECETGHCVDGACCAQSACPDCHSCAAPGSQGQCTAMPSLQGKSCGDSSTSECSQPDTCDDQGVCQPNHVAEGTACGSHEATACTEPDSCDGLGTCLPNHRPEGYECGDNTKNECTDPDTCNGEGACVPNHQPDGTACSGGVCDQGQCSGGGTG
ncbi:MAG TPA: FG-GAP repeat protein, partial [Polyangiaceae bacterium]|nr:FG-GAP repeat protein [Polyangiaceae bacterium]